MTFTEKIEDILPEIDIDTGLMYCGDDEELFEDCLLYTSPSPRDA